MDAKLAQIREDREELEHLLSLAQRARVKDMLSINLRKLDTEYIVTKEKLDQAQVAVTLGQASVTNTPVGRQLDANPVIKAYDTTIKTYSWDQSDKFVKVFLTGLGDLSQVSPDQIVQQFTQHSVSIRINQVGDRNLLFNIHHTGQPIDPKQSYVKVKSDMISIYLAKIERGRQWPHLRASDEVTQKPIAPPKIDETADPSAGLMSMMKQMYEEGDDEMKQTIAKAWSEGQSKNSPF
ncbi:hypothetical protein TCAL_00838 [Tigriopus californicus]|uniref:Calcyclin-binding protein n=1 Tax=Tigriopus californicus TaxID=6832 RepID=A0A553NBL0_TIGCA|nr:calcyclin-binding protein-like [Tigriopus californicus]TRY62808.1 hypothetical protein TCAL_00838 [Tigriopus californicus]|eukprot:TCALIF_00838-PA protein Name:"Similar to CACYBP Calcyclin-binding protein (Bos taurus)" AED:0.00 eAED:0.00 QI:136/1/1/1/0.5/0.4/5/672/236